MKYAKRIIVFYSAYAAVGICILIYALFGNIPDSFRHGMASGLAGSFIAVGILGAIVGARLIRNPKKAKEIELAKTEERTRLIRMSANSLTHTCMIYAESLGTIAAGLIGYETIALTLSGVIIVQLAAYLVCISYYSRKY